MQRNRNGLGHLAISITPQPPRRRDDVTGMNPRITPRLSLLAATTLWLVTAMFASPEKPVIGLSLDTFKEERWQRDRDAFVASVERLGGHTIVRSAEWDDAQQVRDIDGMINAGVDVIAVVPHNASALTEVIGRARAAHIEVISYDRLMLNADVSYYVGTENMKLGELQAQYIADRLPAGRPARVVRIFGAGTDHNAQQIKDGQDRVLSPLIKAGRIEIVLEDWAEDWKPSAGKRITENALAKSNAIDAIIAANDGTAGGAIEALTDHGLAGKVIVTGQDADLAALARIKDGTQSMTIFKPLDQIADLAAQLAIDVAHRTPRTLTASVPNGRKNVPAVFVSAVTVDKSNLSETIAKKLKKK
jgi:D-xylose transport system substrate-binding protein